jgi:hypothetical protein
LISWRLACGDEGWLPRVSVCAGVGATVALPPNLGSTVATAAGYFSFPSLFLLLFLSGLLERRGTWDCLG